MNGQTTVYYQARNRFVRIFEEEFPDAEPGTPFKLLRIASKCQKWNEKSCSIPMDPMEEVREEEKNEDRIIQVSQIIQKLRGTLKYNGDPRGNPLVIYPPSGKDYDWGGGFSVPGVGYTGKELDRMAWEAERLRRKAEGE